MKNNGLVPLFLVAALNVSSAARADLITVAPRTVAIIDFSQYDQGRYTFTCGPEQIGGIVGLDVVFTATGTMQPHGLLGSGGFGLAENGVWANRTHSGLNSSSGALTYTFNFGLVATVGGLVNYVPGIRHPMLEALDRRGNVLESHLLDEEAPVSTPGAADEGAFRGIRRRQVDIAAFRVLNAFFVLDDLTFTATPVPEPSTLLLIGSGALVLLRQRAGRGGGR